MAVRHCNDCTTAYTRVAAVCPHCGSGDAHVSGSPDLDRVPRCEACTEYYPKQKPAKKATKKATKKAQAKASTPSGDTDDGE